MFPAENLWGPGEWNQTIGDDDRPQFAVKYSRSWLNLEKLRSENQKCIKIEKVPFTGTF